MSSPMVSSLTKALLPTQANNEYRGGALPLYLFYALLAMRTFGSFVHFLKEDSGVNSIATIVKFMGTPDPNNVIYMYSSLWGSQQVIMVMIYVLVLVRYRNLIPLMWALLFFELFFRICVGFLHPLTPEYYLRRPPGAVANVPMLLMSAVLCFMALKNTRDAAKGKIRSPMHTE